MIIQPYPPACYIVFKCVLDDADDCCSDVVAVVSVSESFAPATAALVARRRLVSAVSSGEFEPWQLKPDGRVEWDGDTAYVTHACDCGADDCDSGDHEGSCETFWIGLVTEECDGVQAAKLVEDGAFWIKS